MLETLHMLENGSSVIARLEYFQEMNLLISILLCFYALTLGIMCVDGLTSTLIARSKFATDFLIANCNTCALLMWMVGVSPDFQVQKFQYTTNMFMYIRFSYFILDVLQRRSN